MRHLLAAIVALSTLFISSCYKDMEQPSFNTTILAFHDGTFDIMPLQYTYDGSGVITSLSSSYFYPIDAAQGDKVEITISLVGGTIKGGEVTNLVSGELTTLVNNSIMLSCNDGINDQYQMIVEQSGATSYPLIISVGKYSADMAVEGIKELTVPAVGYAMAANTSTSSCYFQFANSTTESVTATVELDLLAGNKIVSILSNDKNGEDGRFALSNINIESNTFDVTMTDGKDDTAAMFYITLTNIDGDGVKKVLLSISEHDGQS